ncbi:MAG: hypothetical protein QM520_01825 [Gammaproteobacteria bacterium]|nr:hypothetical protein [Gammaproteobacteria bacterium]
MAKTKIGATISEEMGTNSPDLRRLPGEPVTVKARYKGVSKKIEDHFLPTKPSRVLTDQTSFPSQSRSASKQAKSVENSVELVVKTKSAKVNQRSNVVDLPDDLVKLEDKPLTHKEVKSSVGGKKPTSDATKNGRSSPLALSNSPEDKIKDQSDIEPAGSKSRLKSEVLKPAEVLVGLSKPQESQVNTKELTSTVRKRRTNRVLTSLNSPFASNYDQGGSRNSSLKDKPDTPFLRSHISPNGKWFSTLPVQDKKLK